MIYLKSVLVGLLTAVFTPLIFVTYVGFITREARRNSDGLWAVAGGGNEMIVLAVLLFAIGSGLMYWHLRP
jgi:hypothetical protein